MVSGTEAGSFDVEYAIFPNIERRLPYTETHEFVSVLDSGTTCRYRRHDSRSSIWRRPRHRLLLPAKASLLRPVDDKPPFRSLGKRHSRNGARIWEILVVFCGVAESIHHCHEMRHHTDPQIIFAHLIGPHHHRRCHWNHPEELW